MRDSNKRRNLNYLDQNQLHMFTSILKQQQAIALMCGLIFVSFKDFVCYVKMKYKKLVQEKKNWIVGLLCLDETKKIFGR